MLAVVGEGNLPKVTGESSLPGLLEEMGMLSSWESHLKIIYQARLFPKTIWRVLSSTFLASISEHDCLWLRLQIWRIHSIRVYRSLYLDGRQDSTCFSRIRCLKTMCCDGKVMILRQFWIWLPVLPPFPWCVSLGKLPHLSLHFFNHKMSDNYIICIVGFFFPWITFFNVWKFLTSFHSKVATACEN